MSRSLLPRSEGVWDQPRKCSYGHLDGFFEEMGKAEPSEGVLDELTAEMCSTKLPIQKEQNSLNATPWIERCAGPKWKSVVPDPEVVAKMKTNDSWKPKAPITVERLTSKVMASLLKTT